MWYSIHVLNACYCLSIIKCKALAASFVYHYNILGEFSLLLLRDNNNIDIPTDGSGRVDVTEIGNDKQNSLLCQYKTRRLDPTDNFRWRVGRKNIPRQMRDSEAGTHYLGWISEAFNAAPNLGIKLYRDPNVTAKDSIFNCNHKDIHQSIEVGIFYHSK